jgi:hypothetical protein
MKMIIPPELGALPGAELSLLGRWRWNALAALFAALVLVALVIRRWRCAEVDDVNDVNELAARPAAGIGESSIVPGVGLAVLLAGAMAIAGLAFFPLAAAPVLAGSDAAVDPAVALVAIDEVGEACAHCGVVESMREIGDDSPIMPPGVEVTLRTRDGVSHLFTVVKSANSLGWRTGERVIYIAGRH